MIITEQIIKWRDLDINENHEEARKTNMFNIMHDNAYIPYTKDYRLGSIDQQIHRIYCELNRIRTNASRYEVREAKIVR